MLNDNQPTWAKLVQLCSEPTTPATLKAAGFTASDIKQANDLGHIKKTGTNANALYSSTFKGRRSLSIVISDQIIAHYRAAPSVAGPAVAPPRESYVPPDTTPVRPGAADFLQCPSRGLR